MRTACRVHPRAALFGIDTDSGVCQSVVLREYTMDRRRFREKRPGQRGPLQISLIGNTDARGGIPPAWRSIAFNKQFIIYGPNARGVPRDASCLVFLIQ